MGEDVRKAATILERHSNLDVDEMRTMEDDRFLYLSIAVENYSKCLAKNHYTRKIENDTSKSMYHDLRIFRLISLWFSNAKHANINNSFKQYMEKFLAISLLDCYINFVLVWFSKLLMVSMQKNS